MEKLEPSRRVIIKVTDSTCPIINVGDIYYIEGPQFQSNLSKNPCLSALISINPWILAARFGIQSIDLGWNNGYNVFCPDKLVMFNINFE